MAENAPVLECFDLSVERRGASGPVRAVDGVSLALSAGELLSVTGPAGSGKSTLLTALAASDTRTVSIVGGSATVCGISLRRPGRSRRALGVKVGYVAQGAGGALPPQSTASEIIAEPILTRERRVNRRALELRVATLLDELHLPLGVADKYPYELSAGMRQRVVIARALVLEPPVFIADELLANLDVQVRQVVTDAIDRRRAEQEMAALLASNDTEAARETDAEMLVLRDGYVVARGHGEELVWTPDTDPARHLA